MKATARRTARLAYTHRVLIRGHELVVDEPPEEGGDDEGPSPLELLAASLASCMAITMELYAKRKGWELGPVEVEVAYSLAERGSATHFDVVMRLSDQLTPEQVERLRVIAGKCPVHRTLSGEVSFDERIELVPAPAL
jgi:putative redox protein